MGGGGVQGLRKIAKSAVSGFQTYKFCGCNIYIDPKLWPNKASSTTHRHKNLKETHTYTHYLYYYIVLSFTLALFTDKNKAISLVYFIALSEYTKTFKNMLLVDWYKTIYQNKTSLSFSNRSVYDLIVEKILLRLDSGKNIAAMMKFQNVWRAFHHPTLMDNW